jgi:hypothetical protein
MPEISPPLEIAVNPAKAEEKPSKSVEAASASPAADWAVIALTSIRWTRTVFSKCPPAAEDVFRKIARK